MPETLEELTVYLRETLPQPKAISHLKPLAEAGAMRFMWNGREFVVKPTLQTMEIKDNKLLLTGASTLMQLVLMGKTRNERVLGAVVENIRQAEEMINNPATRSRGLTLLATVKATLKSLMPRQLRSRTTANAPPRSPV
jgi:hypothetical protein